MRQASVLWAKPTGSETAQMKGWLRDSTVVPNDQH